MRASHDFRFDASSPVGQHWLIHGVGFTVCDSGGETLGVVEDIDVDPVQHRAARVLVRRRGLFTRPRYVAIDSRAVESVLPGPRLFIVAAAEKGASPAPHPTVTERVGGLAQASRPPLAELDRRFAAALTALLRASRRGANAGAETAVSTARRTRRETPKLAAQLSVHTLEAARSAVEVLRFIATAALRAAHLLGEVAVVTAVLVAAAGRRAAASMQQARTPREPAASAPPDPEASSRRRDADSALARETRSGTSMRPTGRRRPDEARSERSARRP